MARSFCCLMILHSFAAGIALLSGCTKQEQPAPATGSTAETQRTADTSKPGEISSRDAEPRQPPAPSGNLLKNGSFEEGPEPGGWKQFDVGSTELPGWVVTRQPIETIGSFWKAADGARSVDLNGPPASPKGGIEQAFPTIPGKRYRVTFLMAANPTGAASKYTMEIHAAGQMGEFTFDKTGRSADDMGWTTQHWEFTADGMESTVEFVSTTDATDGAGPALDGVVVQEAT